MVVMRGYKQTNVGVIPDDWQAATISDVSEKITVGFVGSMAHLFRSNGVPLLRGQNVLPGKLDLSDTRFISAETHKQWSKSALRPGDVVLVRVGYPGTACVIPSELGEANAASLVVVRPKDQSLSASFLVSVANSEFGKRQIESYLVGGAQQVLNIGTAAKFNLPLPPRSEQGAIAEALSDADALIGSLEQLLAKKRQIKQGAMQELLSGSRRLPGFKGAWSEKSIGDLFSITRGLSASREQLSVAGHCYLHYGDIHTTTRTWIDLNTEHINIPKLDVPLGKVSPTALLEDGDVVFVDASEDEDGTSRHMVVVNPDGKPFISGLHTIVAKARDGALDNTYRRYCFQAQAVKKQFRFYAVGTKVSGVTKSNIVKIVLSIPPLPEQSAIAAILSDMDSELSALEAKLAKARQLKRGMMQELLTGRIRLV